MMPHATAPRPVRDLTVLGSLILLILLLAGSADTQDWEHWLRTQPHLPPRYDRTPFPWPAHGKAYPHHQEYRSQNLSRFLRQLREEQRAASLTFESSGPTLSEVTEIENLLLEAAIQAELASLSGQAPQSREPLLPAQEESVSQATGTVAPETESASSTAPLAVQTGDLPASVSAGVLVPPPSFHLTMPASVPVFPGSYSAPADNE